MEQFEKTSLDVVYYKFQKVMKPMRNQNLTLSDGIKTVQTIYFIRAKQVALSRTELNHTQQRRCKLLLSIHSSQLVGLRSTPYKRPKTKLLLVCLPV